MYLLNRSNLGGEQVTSSSGGAVQQFQATHGCYYAPLEGPNAGALGGPGRECGQTLSAAYWDRGADSVLFVWDRNDHLRAFNFNGTRFNTTPLAVSEQSHLDIGGLAVSSNGNDPLSGIVWAMTADAYVDPTYGLVTAIGNVCSGGVQSFRRRSLISPAVNRNLQQHNVCRRRHGQLHKILESGSGKRQSVCHYAVESTAGLWQAHAATTFPLRRTSLTQATAIASISLPRRSARLFRRFNSSLNFALSLVNPDLFSVEYPRVKRRSVMSSDSNCRVISTSNGSGVWLFTVFVACMMGFY